MQLRMEMFCTFGFPFFRFAARTVLLRAAHPGPIVIHYTDRICLLYRRFGVVEHTDREIQINNTDRVMQIMRMLNTR